MLRALQQGQLSCLRNGEATDPMGVMPEPCSALWSLFRAAGTFCAHCDALLPLQVT